MKTIVLFFALFYCNLGFTQLTINAGNDTVFCQTVNGLSFSIGGSPTASNGTPPYTYTWSIKEPYQIPFSSIILHADDFLDDTTTANPTIIDGFGIVDSMKFYLEIEDGLGAVKNDSLLIRFSLFSLGTNYVIYNIWSGDSIYIDQGPGVGGGLGALSYLWQPNTGLIDSTGATFWTQPNQTVDYYCIVTDAFNCSITTNIQFHVIVNYLNIEELVSINAYSVTIFPNPTSGEIYLKINSSDIRNIYIYDANMKLIGNVDSSLKMYDLSHYEKGVYIINFEFKNETISKKVILQ